MAQDQGKYVFLPPWIDDVAIGSRARPVGLGEAVGLGFFPFCLIFDKPVSAFTTHPKLTELYWNK
jgi:hypothetical protein